MIIKVDAKLKHTDDNKWSDFILIENDLISYYKEKAIVFTNIVKGTSVQIIDNNNYWYKQNQHDWRVRDV